ncbi:hypothetical protein HanIR_Chr10g0480201 [Helianthus annuus]|nr:hypothetical protein HanIR_Chr10g0480201 [Helianthus annuus]
MHYLSLNLHHQPPSLQPATTTYQPATTPSTLHDLNILKPPQSQHHLHMKKPEKSSFYLSR